MHEWDSGGRESGEWESMYIEGLYPYGKSKLWDGDGGGEIGASRVAANMQSDMVRCRERGDWRRGR